MMYDANFPEAEQELFWAEAVHTCTQIDNILTNNEGKSPAELFCGQKPTLARYLRVFGEACVFANRDKIKSKLQDQGEVGMFLGYSLLHDDSTYRIYKPSTKHVVLSQDLIWLKRLFFNNDKTKTKYKNILDKIDMMLLDMSQITPDKITSDNNGSEEVYNNIPSTTPKRSSRNINWFQSRNLKTY